MSQGASGRAEGGQLEEKVDLSSETTSKISQAQSLLSSSPSNLGDALALLAALEKRCRVGNDSPSLIRVCEASLEICKDAGDEEALLATLKNLSTRRSQKSKAIGALVSKCIPWVVDSIDGFTPLPIPSGEGETAAKAARDALVEELRNITDGKMYLEAERARLTRTMAIIQESYGNIAAAAEVLQEVHVETYGSISKREKVEFILEQMRLTLAKKDYVRAHIVSNKIQKKTLFEEGMSEEKIKFYTLLTQYHRHEKDALELAKDYHAIYSTPSVQEKEEEWKEALTNTVVFLCLSEYGNEMRDMMERVNLDGNLDKIPECRDTIKSFLKKEIIHYPLPHQTILESIPAFNLEDDGSTNTDSTTTSSSLASHWHTTFHTRIIQHNLRTVSIYYRQIHLSRLAQLLSLTSPEIEKHISQMVSNGSLYAKIDRPKDIVRFNKTRSSEEVLSDWAGDIKTLLHLVDETSYLIQKENMVQSH